MIPVKTYDGICDILTQRFQKRFEIPYPVRMVGLLFARPDLDIVKSEILPSLNYFHFRAGWHIDFFFVGYNYKEMKKDSSNNRKIKVGDKEWNYNDISFNNFREYLESTTEWKYSGGVDLILLNTKYEEESLEINLDFSTAISMQLDRALIENAIPSISTFFEEIFQYAENYQNSNPVYNFSDKMGVRKGLTELVNVVLRRLPFEFGNSVKRLSYFSVKNIR